MTELSDELLVSYVDGQLARAQSRAVEGVLDHDEVSAQRVAALKAAHDRLESAFDAILAGEFVSLTGMQPLSEVEEQMPEPVPAQPRRRGVIVSAFMLGLGAVGGYFVHDQLSPAPWQTVAEAQMPDAAQNAAGAPPAAQGTQVEQGSAEEGPVLVEPETASESPSEQLAKVDASGAEGGADTPSPERNPLVTGSVTPAIPPRAMTWRDDAERVFSLYGRDTLEISLDSQSNPDFVSFQLAKALETEVELPQLSAQDLTFKRLQILQHEGEPLAQILYLPREGDPVALYAMAEKSRFRSPTTLHATENIGMASWTQDGVAYLLAAHLPEDEIMALAKAIRGQNSDQK